MGYHGWDNNFKSGHQLGKNTVVAPWSVALENSNACAGTTVPAGITRNYPELPGTSSSRVVSFCGLYVIFYLPCNSS